MSSHIVRMFIIIMVPESKVLKRRKKISFQPSYFRFSVVAHALDGISIGCIRESEGGTRGRYMIAMPRKMGLSRRRWRSPNEARREAERRCRRPRTRKRHPGRRARRHKRLGTSSETRGEASISAKEKRHSKETK